MRTGGRAYVLSAAAALVAMASRAGWIDWQAAGHVAAVGLILATGVAAILVLAVMVVGIPLVLVVAATAGGRRIFREKSTGRPPA